MEWQEFINREKEKDYFKNIVDFLENEEESYNIYPPKDKIFRAFDLCSFNDTKVLILGQDPYQNPGLANGLSFSVNSDMKIPPSLRNIYKELQEDLNLDIPKHGDLTSWAEQGVLLINTSLTVREKEPGSHSRIGWEAFTDKVIRLISDKEQAVVFILWGKHAQSKESLINPLKNLILKSAHPSPLSAYRGFFNSKPFSKANDYLRANNIKEIDWKIE